MGSCGGSAAKGADDAEVPGTARDPDTGLDRDAVEGTATVPQLATNPAQFEAQAQALLARHLEMHSGLDQEYTAGLAELRTTLELELKGQGIDGDPMFKLHEPDAIGDSKDGSEPINHVDESGSGASNASTKWRRVEELEKQKQDAIEKDDLLTAAKLRDQILVEREGHVAVQIARIEREQDAAVAKGDHTLAERLRGQRRVLEERAEVLAAEEEMLEALGQVPTDSPQAKSIRHDLQSINIIAQLQEEKRVAVLNNDFAEAARLRDEIAAASFQSPSLAGSVHEDSEIRQIHTFQQQKRQAVAEKDFKKAASLRDKIEDLGGGSFRSASAQGALTNANRGPSMRSSTGPPRGTSSRSSKFGSGKFGTSPQVAAVLTPPGSTMDSRVSTVIDAVLPLADRSTTASSQQQPVDNSIVSTALQGRQGSSASSQVTRSHKDGVTNRQVADGDTNLEVADGITHCEVADGVTNCEVADGVTNCEVADGVTVPPAA